MRRGGLSQISDVVNNLQGRMTAGLMMGIAYLFGSDTANPWGVPDTPAPTYSTEIGEPFREVNQASNENYIQEGGNNHFVNWLMLGVGLAGGKQLWEDITHPDE